MESITPHGVHPFSSQQDINAGYRRGGGHGGGGGSRSLGSPASSVVSLVDQSGLLGSSRSVVGPLGRVASVYAGVLSTLAFRPSLAVTGMYPAVVALLGLRPGPARVPASVGRDGGTAPHSPQPATVEAAPPSTAAAPVMDRTPTAPSSPLPETKAEAPPKEEVARDPPEHAVVANPADGKDDPSHRGGGGTEPVAQADKAAPPPKAKGCCVVM